MVTARADRLPPLRSLLFVPANRERFLARLDSLHPDAVYDTGLWTAELLAARAKAYNLTVEQYKKRNLLKTEVSSRDVAELAAEMCGPLFARTTAAQLPVDGGNERVV